MSDDLAVTNWIYLTELQLGCFQTQLNGLKLIDNIDEIPLSTKNEMIEAVRKAAVSCIQTAKDDIMKLEAKKVSLNTAKYDGYLASLTKSLAGLRDVVAEIVDFQRARAASVAIVHVPTGVCHEHSRGSTAVVDEHSARVTTPQARYASQDRRQRNAPETTNSIER